MLAPAACCPAGQHTMPERATLDTRQALSATTIDTGNDRHAQRLSARTVEHGND